MGYLDLHSHVLPGVDDGAASLTEALEILAAAWRAGTEAMAATPHMYQPGLGSDDPAAVRRAFDHFVAAVEAQRATGRYGELELHLGAENFVGAELLAAAAGGEALTLADSRFLLVEFWPMATADNARRALAALQDAGYVPLMAHVERYAFLDQDPDLLARLVDEGCVAQVNAAAILGRQGLRLAQLADLWLRRGLVAVVASDGHGVSSRPPQLDEVARHLESRYGAATAELCLSANPRAILADRAPTLPAPRRSRWWRRD